MCLSSVKVQMQSRGQEAFILEQTEWKCDINQCRCTCTHTDCTGTYVRHREHGCPLWLLKLFTQAMDVCIELAGWLRAPWHCGPISGPKPNLFENRGVFYLGSLATAVYSQSRSAVRANSNLQEDLMGKVTSVPLTRLQRNITSVSNPQFIWRSEGTDLIKTAAGHWNLSVIRVGVHIFKKKHRERFLSCYYFIFVCFACLCHIPLYEHFLLTNQK